MNGLLLNDVIIEAQNGIDAKIDKVITNVPVGSNRILMRLKKIVKKRKKINVIGHNKFYKG